MEEVDWDSDLDDELALQCLDRLEAEKADFYKNLAERAEDTEVDWDLEDDALALSCLDKAERDREDKAEPEELAIQFVEVEAKAEAIAADDENTEVDWNSEDDELALQCLDKAERDRKDKAEELAIQSVERAEALHYLYFLEAEAIADCLDAEAIADEVEGKAKAEAKADEDRCEKKKTIRKQEDKEQQRIRLTEYAERKPEAIADEVEGKAKAEAIADEDRREKKKARREQEDEEQQRIKLSEYAEQKHYYKIWIRDMVLANHRLRNRDEVSDVNRNQRYMIMRGFDAKSVKDYVKCKRNSRKDYYKKLTIKAETATGMVLSAIRRDGLNVAWSIPPVVTNFKVWKIFGGVFIHRKEYGPLLTCVSPYKVLHESDLIDKKRAKKGLPPLPFHDLDRMMCFAALGNAISLIRNEVDNGFDPFNTKWFEKELYTPLDMAASRGQMGVVQYLTGEDFKEWRWHGQQAIREAAQNGHVAVVSYLARKLHCSRVHRSPFDEREIFSYMVAGGSADSVDRLLAKNLDSRASIIVNTKDHDGDYPIGIAAAHGNSEMIFCLFAHGSGVGIVGLLVSINSYDSLGRQPIHLAAMGGHHLVIEMLVNAGAEFDGPTFLADKSADKQSELGNTPLHISAARDCVSCCKLLIDKGASMFKRNNVGNTPLHVAVIERSLRTVIYLVQRGADLTIQNEFGETPSTLATVMLAEVAPDDNVWQHICDFFNGVDDSTTKEYRRFPNLLVDV